MQDDVISELKSVGLEPEEEVLTKSGYRLDAVVGVNGKKIGIEVDGPSHFVGRKPAGSTILKHRQVTKLDEFPIVSVPYWEWNELGKDRSKKRQYLQKLLANHVSKDSSTNPSSSSTKLKKECQYLLEPLCRNFMLIIGHV